MKTFVIWTLVIVWYLWWTDFMMGIAHGQDYHDWKARHSFRRNLWVLLLAPYYLRKNPKGW